MKCPECGKELIVRGYVGSGHTIYICLHCKCNWEIKKTEQD